MNTGEKEYVTVKPMTSQFDPTNSGKIEVSRRSTVMELMDQYHDVAKGIHRITGMGQLKANYSEMISQLRVILVKLRMYINNPNVTTKTGTIVDGTFYDNIEPNKKCLGIEYINHLWVDDKAYACIVIGHLEWHITPSLYWKRTSDVRSMVVVPLEDLSFESIAACFTKDMISTDNYAVNAFKLHSRLFEMVQGIASKNEEYPVAAAIYNNGTVFEMQRPYRHHHVIQTKEYSDHNKAQAEGKVVIQGFVTNFGHFIGRRRALFLAAKKQMILTDMKMSMISTDAEQFFRYPEIESKMSGKFNGADALEKTYAVADTGLFSEDLW